MVDMARFLTNLEGTRGQAVLNAETRRLMIEPPPPPLKVPEDGVFTGLGWDNVLVRDKNWTVFKDGSYQGMRTFMKRLPTSVCWCLCYNCSMEFDPVDSQICTSAIHEVRQLVEGIERLPDVDLFREYR